MVHILIISNPSNPHNTTTDKNNTIISLQALVLQDSGKWLNITTNNIQDNQISVIRVHTMVVEEDLNIRVLVQEDTVPVDHLKEREELDNLRSISNQADISNISSLTTITISERVWRRRYWTNLLIQSILPYLQSFTLKTITLNSTKLLKQFI